MAAQDFGDEAGDMVWNFFKNRVKDLGRAVCNVGVPLAGSAAVKAGSIVVKPVQLAGAAIGGLVLDRALPAMRDIWEESRLHAAIGEMLDDMKGRVGALLGKGAQAPGGVQTVQISVKGETVEQRFRDWTMLKTRLEQALSQQGLTGRYFIFDGRNVANTGVGTFSYNSKYEDKVVAAIASAKEQQESEVLTVSLGMRDQMPEGYEFVAANKPATAEQKAAVDKLAALGAISDEDLVLAGEKAGWSELDARRLMAGAKVKVKVPMCGMDSAQIARAAAALRDEWLEKGLDGIDVDLDFKDNILKVQSTNVESFEALVQEATQELARKEAEYDERQREERRYDERQRGAEEPSRNRAQSRPRARGGKEDFEERCARAKQASEDVAAGKTPDPRRGRTAGAQGESHEKEGRAR